MLPNESFGGENFRFRLAIIIILPKTTENQETLLQYQKYKTPEQKTLLRRGKDYDRDSPLQGAQLPFPLPFGLQMTCALHARSWFIQPRRWNTTREMASRTHSSRDKVR